MTTASQILLLASALGAGLTAGVCFAFSSFLLTAFDRLGSAAAIRTMQSINATILRSGAIVVWFATVLLGIAAAILAEATTIAAVAAALYAIGAVLVTGGRNVPLNEALDRIAPDSDEGARAWHDYRRRWGRWNTLRTTLFVAATAGFALALAAGRSGLPGA
ncbi:MAG: DUF1772 domain-containing protein [Planctomycetota bacterium]